jgi:hypothetical protein
VGKLESIVDCLNRPEAAVKGSTWQESYQYHQVKDTSWVTYHVSAFGYTPAPPPPPPPDSLKKKKWEKKKKKKKKQNTEKKKTIIKN